MEIQFYVESLKIDLRNVLISFFVDGMHFLNKIVPCSCFFDYGICIFKYFRLRLCHNRVFIDYRICISIIRYLRGGGGDFRPITLEKKYFELGVRGEGQDTSRKFEGSFGSIRAILPM